jgi:hypothetical protein
MTASKAVLWIGAFAPAHSCPPTPLAMILQACADIQISCIGRLSGACRPRRLQHDWFVATKLGLGQ